LPHSHADPSSAAVGNAPLCKDDGNGTYSCGAVPQGSSAEVALVAVPKNAGNFQPGWQTFTDTLGAGDWANMSSGDMSWNEIVNAS
jgi:hypothetical protein